MTKKWNTSGADELYSKLIFIGVFCGVSAFLFISITPIIQSGAYMGDPKSFGQTIEIPDEVFYAPQPFPVDNTTVKDRYQYGHETITFTSGMEHRHDIDAYVVRDNAFYNAIQPRYYWANDYKDCILFEMNYGLFNTKHKNAAISYESIGKAFSNQTNYAKLDFTLNTGVSLFVSTGPGYAFLDALYWNEFNMSIGFSWNMSDEITHHNSSPWTLVSQILTFSVPEIGYELNLMIGIPAYLTIGFLILAVVSRFFPTVPGL